MPKPKISKSIKIVVKFETIRQLKKPSFWIALLLFPVLTLGMIGLSALNNSSFSDTFNSKDFSTIGITDQANIFTSVEPQESTPNQNTTTITQTPLQSNILNPTTSQNSTPKPPKIIFYDTKQAGIDAVKSNAIEAYYFIPKDFSKSANIESYVRTQEDYSLFTNYETFFRTILQSVASTRTSASDSLILSNNYHFSSTTFDTQGNTTNILGKAIIPIFILVIFYLLICVFGNRMLMSVTEEKENRISEMILTAISAKQLIIGKIIAIILLGFVQMAVLIIPAIALIFANRDNPLVSGVISSIEFSPIPLISNIILLFASYFLFAGLSTLVGSLVPTAREASSYIGVVMIGLVLPFFFINQVTSNQPTLITYILSYFPLSAPMALMLRNAFGSLPWYEFLISTTEILICSIIVINLTVKSFQKNAINFSITRPSFRPRKIWK